MSVRFIIECDARTYAPVGFSRCKTRMHLPNNESLAQWLPVLHALGWLVAPDGTRSVCPDHTGGTP